MRSAIRKDFFREIKNGMGRFLSILFIVALGTAFFSGIRSTESAMKKTGDVYFDNTNLMDIKILSTLGLTKEDVQALENLDLVKQAMGSYAVDAIHVMTDDDANALRVMALLDGMNEYILTQGRLPNEAGECLLDEQYAMRNDLQIGDSIVLRSGKDDELSAMLENTIYTITGFATTPQYMGFSRGYTNIGSGELSGFMAVMQKEFVENEIYTEIYLHIEGAKGEVAFSKSYEQLVQQGMEEIEEIQDVRRAARRDEVVQDAQTELAKAQEEYQEEKEKVENELADALVQIEDAGKELADAKEQIRKGEQALQNARTELGARQKEIDAGWSSYHEGIKEIEEAKQEYALAIPQIEEGERNLTQGKGQLQEERNQFEEMKEFLTVEQIVAFEMELATAEQELIEGRAALEQGRNQLIDANNQIIEGEKQLGTARTQLIDGQRQIDNGWGQIAREERTLLSAKQEVANGDIELADAQKEYEEGRQEAEEEFAKIEKELEDAKQEIAEIELPQWYVEDRAVLTDYTGFEDNANSMRAIGQVFPVIFFMVAALISLTAMTRMVEEQRTQIGTLKALGYSKVRIALKYICYALLATVLGSVLGVLIGGKLFPFVIISAYTSMYEGIPEIIVPYHVPYALFASVLALACTLGATFVATYTELAMRPAILMRPPYPKNGKRVLLERIPFLWKRLNFSWKSTIRNLLRYKKRFMMTVLGIGACMGLMLIGFGLRDSIMDIGRLQYRNVQHEEATLYLQEDLQEADLQMINDEINTWDNVDNFMQFYTRVTVLTHGTAKEEADIMVPKNRDEVSAFFSFQDRVSGQEYELNENEVILTEKMAKTLDVRVGDNIGIQLADYEEKTVRVSAITENYIFHYIFVSLELYQQLYGTMPAYNMIQLNIEETMEDEVYAIGELAVSIENVQGVSYASTMERAMDDMLGSMSLVLVILIASAGLLAFVVLYNLNTININERRRELATIKVLGFFDTEVSAYVFRENILLMILGMLAGVAFGKGMHHFVITTVEVELLMFGRNINFPSYLYSMAFTVLFSMLVNAAMHLKLKKIDMVESLKNAE